MLPEQPHGAAAGGAQKPSKGGCSAARGSRNLCLERVLGERSFAERKEGAAPCSLVHAVGGGHHPVPLDEGASAGVVPAAAGVILEGDLGRGRGRGRGLSAQGPGARRAPGSPVGPRQDSPGRARRASAPRSHRPPAASHRDRARSSALGTEGRRESPARGARGGGVSGGAEAAGSGRDFTAEGEGGEEHELQHHPGARCPRRGRGAAPRPL